MKTKIVVCIKNIAYSCGTHYLKKGRIVSMIEGTRKIFRDKERMDNDDYTLVPLEVDEMNEYFKDANEAEIAQFNELQKAIV